MCDGTASRRHSASSIAITTLRRAWMLSQVDGWSEATSYEKDAKQIHAIRRTTCLLSFQFFNTGLNPREFYAENRRNTHERSLARSCILSTEKKMRTFHEGTRRMIYHNDRRSILKDGWMEKLQTLKQPVLQSRASQNLNLYQKWNQGSTICVHISRKTVVAKYAEGRT